VKLSGGEPFRHPNFLEAVGALAGAKRRVSVVTNLSAPLADLYEFLDRTRARPGLISASLHLEYVDPHAFLDKVRALAERHAGSIVVTCVATRANLPRLEALRERFVAAGLAFRVQPEKQDRDVIDYDDAEREQLIQLGGHNGTGRIAPSFAGQPCWAGARYFIVDHRGDAFRCYPSRRHRREHLGNFLDGTFRLRLEPEPCRYSYCNCTVPQQRGMVAMERS
jgi:MoaA/NifB/PqqE/SkfB family radical SAM enzyme